MGGCRAMFQRVKRLVSREFCTAQRRNVISSNPANLSWSLTVSAPAIENGPGPQVGSLVSSG